jgi:hypothetical protein
VSESRTDGNGHGPSLCGSAIISEIKTPVDAASAPQLTVVANWMSELARR